MPAAKPEEVIAGSRVLVLEADGALRVAIRMLLQATGYHVLTAGSLPAALEIARSEPGIGILLVEDHPASGVVGAQAIAALREVIGPQLQALLITQRITASLRGLEQEGVARLVIAPVGADALIAAMQQLRRPCGPSASQRPAAVPA
jgi:CheY-like chemotaxis protein